MLGDNPIAVGQPLAFQVLRDGRPLAGFPVELVSERSPLGIWRETDANGMLHHTLPFAGLTPIPCGSIVLIVSGVTAKNPG